MDLGLRLMLASLSLLSLAGGVICLKTGVVYTDGVPCRASDSPVMYGLMVTVLFVLAIFLAALSAGVPAEAMRAFLLSGRMPPA